MSKNPLLESSIPQALFDLNGPSMFSNPEYLKIHRTRFVLPAASDNGHAERVLEIPDKLLDSDLVNLIMEYLYSTHVSRFTEATKFSALAQLAKFFEFVESIDKVSLNDAAIVYPKYKKYLEKKTKETNAYKLFMAVGKVLRWAKNQDAIGNTPKYWTEVTKDTLNRIPLIPANRSKPMQTVSKALQFDEVDDDVLLLSIRSYATYFLDKSYQLREFIKTKSPEVFFAVEEILLDKGLMDLGLNSSLMTNSLSAREYKTLDGVAYKNRLFDLKKLLISVLRSAPEGLIEFFPSLIDHNQIKDLLYKSVIDDVWPPIQANWQSTLKLEKLNFPLVNLFFPTIPEQIAMCYLLSSDRIQPSGINRLKIDNFRLTNNSVQICDFNKARAGKGFDTPVYKSNSPVFKAYLRWFNMFSWLHEACVLNRVNHFMPSTTTKLNHQIKMLSMSTLDWYAPLLMDGRQRSIAISECPEVEYFVKAMNGKIGDRHNRGARVKNKPSFLSVAHSRAILELQPIRGLNSELSDDILAGLSAHSIETSRNTYKDRTDSNNIVRSGRMFSADIAQNMEELAQSAKILLNRTSIVELEEIEKTIGFARGSKDFSDSIDSLLEHANAMGYEIGLAGEISDNKITYVICTPLIAGLIQGEIKHIHKNLSQLQNESPSRFRIHNTRLVYLELVLEHFDSNIVAEGRKLLDKYDFPFPPLS